MTLDDRLQEIRKLCRRASKAAEAAEDANDEGDRDAASDHRERLIELLSRAKDLAEQHDSY